MTWTLDVDGDARPFGDADGSELSALIAEVARATLEFLILTNDATGEYVQCAEAHERLVAERRERGSGRWRHYRVCQRGGSRERLPPRVEGYEGYEQRELLDPEQVELIFRDFLAGRPPSDGFELMDTTDEYPELAEDAEAQAETRSVGFFSRMKSKFFGS